MNRGGGVRPPATVGVPPPCDGYGGGWRWNGGGRNRTEREGK